jgi:hypothetical protein
MNPALSKQVGIKNTGRDSARNANDAYLRIFFRFPSMNAKSIALQTFAGFSMAGLAMGQRYARNAELNIIGNMIYPAKWT